MKIPTCKICTEDFTDENGIRVPKTLHCSHSICLNCATNSVVNNGIICPFCREATQLGPKGVGSLKKNFGLLEVLEDAKFSKNQLGRESALSSPPQCPLHSYNVAEFVCVNKECKDFYAPMCRTCEEFGVHKGHEKRLLQDESAKLREIVRQTIEDLKTKQEKTEKSMNAIQEWEIKCSLNGDAYTNTVNEIASHFEQIRKEVNEKEEHAMNVLKACHAVSMQILQQHNKETSEKLSKKEEQLATFDQLLCLRNSDLLTKHAEITMKCKEFKNEKESYYDPTTDNCLVPSFYSHPVLLKFLERDYYENGNTPYKEDCRSYNNYDYDQYEEKRNALDDERSEFEYERRAFEKERREFEEERREFEEKRDDYNDGNDCYEEDSKIRNYYDYDVYEEELRALEKERREFEEERREFEDERCELEREYCAYDEERHEFEMKRYAFENGFAWQEEECDNNDYSEKERDGSDCEEDEEELYK